MKLFKLSIKDLLNNKRFLILFILNLSLGLSGFISLTTFKSSISHTIAKRSKSIAGGDLGIRARRPILEEERKTATNQIKDDLLDTTYTVEMFSMVANAKGKSRLVQVKAIENNYPFYGKIALKEEREREKNSIWVFEDVLQQLKVSIGDTLKVGTKEFKISNVVVEDSTSGIGTSMAPLVYLTIDQLKTTGLLRKGSVARHIYLYKTRPTEEEVSAQRDRIFNALSSQDIRVFTHESASNRSSRMLSRLNDFLGLSTLVALFLSALGSAYLFRSYFNSKVKEIAVLMSLGLSRPKSFIYYLYQILLLGIVSTIFSLILSSGIVKGIEAITASLLPFSVDIILSTSTIVASFLIGIIGSILFCLPILLNISRINLATLLSSDELTKGKSGSLVYTIITYSLIITFFYTLAVYLSKSILIGSTFIATFIVAGILLSILSWIIFTKLNLQKKVKTQSLKWALRDLERKKLTTLSCFISIGLGTLLLNLIPQIESSLERELQAPEQSKIPNLFLFDIQEEQLPDLQTAVTINDAKISKLSPMIRARLMAVNGENFDKVRASSKKPMTREQEREMRFRNRGFNLTYSLEEQDSERIIKGVPFSGPFDETKSEISEISLEKRFADRLHLKIGDLLEFSVEGIPVKGKVINLRTIKWTSFDPNFFVKFQPGVLDLAPKTFIATISQLSNEQRQRVQDSIVEKLPNVSMINVTALMKRLQGFMEQMAYSLKFMSILCLLVGFIVVYSIANHQAYKQRFEIGLLKSLGGSFPMIRNHYLIQFSLISINASLFGAGISLIISYLMSWILFDGVWVFDIFTPISSVLACVMITVVITFFAVSRSLKTRASQLF